MQPSLHEYSIFAMKLRLNDDYAIAFPIKTISHKTVVGN